jgi:hypothetical protein
MKLLILCSKESNGIFVSNFIDCSETPLFPLRYIGRVKGNDSGAKPQNVNREGKAMLFLIRAAFWLMIIVLLLPTDAQQRSEVYGTAQAAVNDVASFCDRNPETCARGKDAFAVFVQKAQFGARMLMDLIQNKTGSGDTATPVADTRSSEASSLVEPARFDMSASQDTLNPEDREEAWSGPDPAGT